MATSYRLLTLTTIEQAQAYLQRQAYRVFGMGDKAGKLLAMLLREERNVATIPLIKNTNGDLITQPCQIIDTFK